MFPALAPIRREWEFPDYPLLEYDHPDGSASTVYVVGNDPLPLPMALVYELIDEPEMQSIRDHYFNVQKVTPFPLPEVCLTGLGSVGGSVPIIEPNTNWRYTEPPTENLKSFYNYEVTVNLRSIP